VSDRTQAGAGEEYISERSTVRPFSPERVLVASDTVIDAGVAQGSHVAGRGGELLDAAALLVTLRAGWGGRWRSFDVRCWWWRTSSAFTVHNKSRREAGAVEHALLLVTHSEVGLVRSFVTTHAGHCQLPLTLRIAMTFWAGRGDRGAAGPGKRVLARILHRSSIASGVVAFVLGVDC